MKPTMQTNRGYAAVIIIVLVVIAAGAYILWQKKQEALQQPKTETTQIVDNSASLSANALSSEIDSIGNEDSSAELNAINAEFK
jgi:uncharacterized protein YpmB